MNSSRFLRFDVTDVMEKSLDETGRPRRILGGFAAGTTKDFQEEQFLLKGMNFDYLNSPQGKVNWDHDPRLVIGRPLFVGMVDGKGLYVKGLLSEKQDYPNPNHPDAARALDQAEWAWDQAQRHKNDPVGNPPLAWSVEGGKVNQNGVLVKSIVTAVALTDQAVNPHDCTVTALAKSLRQAEAVDVVEKAGFPIDEIVDGQSYMKFFKSIGFSADQSLRLFNTIRSL